MPASRSPKSAVTPASRRCSTAGSRPCIPKCTPASWRVATSPAHMQALADGAIPTIDLVVVNLYPFSQTVAKADCTLEEAIENIDIGGPTMVRAAAKNYQHVAVVTDPADYAAIAAGNAGCRAERSQRAHALRARAQSIFAHRRLRRRDQQLSHRDRRTRQSSRVSAAAQSQFYPSCRSCATARIRISTRRSTATATRCPGALASYVQLQGKELSYNNIADADAAWECVKTFEQPACVIVKHANPCGVAIADRSAAAPTSARSRPTRPRRSAASSLSTASSMLRPREP